METPLTRTWTIAAPSWVMPGTVAENCRFLAGRVHDVAIMLFETAACLAYTSEDIPPDPGRLPAAGGGALSFHLHLPLDLPWSDGGRVVADVVEALLGVTARLHPWGYVLHAPPEHEVLEDFLAHWQRSGRSVATLILENTEDNAIAALLPVARRTGCRLCLDIGHLMAYGQGDLPGLSELQQHTAMLHLYSPWKSERSGGSKKTGHGHYSLEHLDERGRCVLRRLLGAWSSSACARPVLVLEVFDWLGVSESLALLRGWLPEDNERDAGA